VDDHVHAQRVRREAELVKGGPDFRIGHDLVQRLQVVGKQSRVAAERVHVLTIPGVSVGGTRTQRVMD
jgi:hypothetical protein